MNEDQSTIVLPLGRPDFRHHLLQALIDWCEECNYTPYILIKVDDETLVPKEYVNDDGTIVLSIASFSIKNFDLNHQKLSFEARFGLNVQNIYIPINRIAALFPKENPDLVSYFSVTQTKRTPKDHTKASQNFPAFTRIK